MKIYLNLLPEERKNKIKRKKLIRLIMGQWTRLFFIVLIFTSTLLSFNFVLKIKLGALEVTHSLEESREEFQKINQYEETFKEINKQTAVISNIQAKHFYWSEVLSELEEAISNEISIIDITAENNQILLVGKAETRDDLVKFKDIIIDSDCFNDAEVPISNFIAKENIDFQMDIKLSEDCLRNSP